MSQALRVRRSKEERAQLISEFHRSGLSVSAFAARTGLSAMTLRNWLRDDENTVPRFANVTVVSGTTPVSSPHSQLVCTLEIGQGRKLSIPISADPRWVAALVDSLR